MPIITSGFQKIHISIPDLPLNLSSEGTITYNLLSNSSDTNISCYVDLFLSTLVVGQTVTILIEQLDNDVVQITNTYTITSSSNYFSKIVDLYTQNLRITLTTPVFDGHIYGNIKKIPTQVINTNSTIPSVYVTNLSDIQIDVSNISIDLSGLIIDISGQTVNDVITQSRVLTVHNDVSGLDAGLVTIHNDVSGLSNLTTSLSGIGLLT